MKHIFDLWPSVPEFAADVGIPDGTAYQMRQRGSISPSHWGGMMDAAQRRDIALTFAELSAAYAAAKAKRTA